MSTEYIRYPENGGTSAAVTIGSTIINGGTPGLNLYVDGSGKLGQQNLDLIYARLNGATFTGEVVLDPTFQVNQNSAATIGQLVAFVSGLAWKSPGANTASVANINLAAPGAAIDGYTFVGSGTDSFLAKDQTVSAENGIYTWNGAASPATRRTDADSSSELTAATIEIIGGSQSGQAFTQTTANPVIGTDPIVWADVGKIYLAGSGLSLVGNTFSIATGGIVNSMVNAAAAIAYSKLNLTGSIVNADIASGAAIAYSKLNLAGSVNMASDVTGILPMLNGGSGVSSIAAGFVKSNGTILSSVSSIDLTADVTGILPVANGGTGNNTSFSAGRVIVSGTGQYTSFGTFLFSSNVLTVGGSIRLNGTAGSSFIDLAPQGANPATVGSGAQIFSNIANQFSVLNPSGFASAISNLGLTADRVFTLQDSSYTIANVPSSGFVKSNGSTLSSVSTISLTADVTGILPTANGGTNNSSYTNKSVIFYDGTKLSEDNANFSYDSGTGLLSSKAIATIGTAGAGFISLVNQSSVPSTPVSGIKIYSDNAGRFNFLNTAGRSISLDTSLLTASRIQQYPDASGVFGLVPLPGFVKASGNLLISQAAISLSADVSGILPTANGGTNTNSSAATGIAHVSAGTWTYSAVNLASADVTGVLPVANGGAIQAAQGTTIVEDFLGNTVNSIFAVSAAGTAAGQGVINTTSLLGWRPGVAQFTTGSTAAGRSGIGQTVNAIAVGNNIATYVFESDILLPIVSTGTDRFTVSCGFNNVFTAAVGTNFIGFTYIDNVNAGAWVCTTSSASITTVTNTAVAMAANTWFKLTATVNSAGTSVTFAINGTTVATHTTNIPTSQTLNPISNIIKSIGVNPRVMDIDYHKLSVTMVTSR